MKLDLIEPLRELFKDEVRELGLELGMPEEAIYRQPFPGPGLGIRIMGEVTGERLAILRQADVIVLEEMKKERLVPQGLAVVCGACCRSRRSASWAMAGPTRM